MLKITISGPAGCGKSTVARIVEKTLREEGFNPLVNDTDRLSEEQINLRTSGLRGTKNPILIDVKNDARKAPEFKVALTEEIKNEN